MIAYLLKQGTSLTFTAFLNQLRNGSDIDHAVSDNYSRKFRGWADFTKPAWQGSL